MRLKQRVSRNGGFTLVEMLIVVAVIGILVGLLMPTVGKIIRKSKMVATYALINGIGSALERYHTQFDAYPPSTISFLPGDITIDPHSLYIYLCGSDGRGPVQYFPLATPPNNIKHFEPFWTPPTEFSVGVAPNVTIIDSWGMPLVYLNCKAYTDRQIAANPAYTAWNGTSGDTQAHNPQSFDMYSTGPDKKKDPNHDNTDNNSNGLIDEAAEMVDDITNYPSGGIPQ